ncbi:MAG: peptide ABC transporter substrate-binding protein [Candidatus Magasanikiibacteriota bacterium]
MTKIIKFIKRLRIKQVDSFVTKKHDLKLMRRVHQKKLPQVRQLFHVGHVLSTRERRIFKFSFLLLIIGIIWFAGEFISNNRTQVPARGGKYVEAVVGSPQLVNPVFASSNDVDMDITRLVFSGLLRYNEKNGLIKDLAAGYEISADKKVYTFELRKDVVWHDGEPLTARDVLFTFDTMQNILVGSPLAVSFQGVKVSALDDYTVRFELAEPFAPFLSSLTVGIIPEHVWYNVAPEQMRLAQVNIEPIGTGPFMFNRLAKDSTGHIYTYELTRFKDFYGEVAFLEDFVFQFYPEYDNDTGAVQALRSQKVTGLNFVPKNLQDRVDRKHIVLHTMQLAQYSALFFNQSRNEILKNSEVREALAYAVDKDRILREAVKGEGKVISNPILPGFPGYNADLAGVKFSLEKANEVLDKNWPKISGDEYKKLRRENLIKEWETGNPDLANTTSTPASMVTGTESNVVISTSTPRSLAEAEIDKKLDEEFNTAQTFYRKDKSGKILVLDLVTSDNEESKRAAELVMGFWQEIGVKTNLKLVAPRDVLRDVLKNHEYDVLLYGVIVGNDPDQYAFWHSSQIDYPGLNLSRYVNRNVDALLIKIRETTDETQLVDLYKKLQETILADRPAVFLYTPTYTYATTDQIKGVDVTNISHPSDRLNDVNTWYMKTKGEWNF